jgi:tetratricopeptide (TPR) repeat protein
MAQDNIIEARKLNRQGLAALDSSDLVSAMKFFKAAQQLDTANINYRYQIATVHFLKKDFKQSLRVLQPLLTHRDISPNMIRLTANNYDNLGQQDKAIEYYKKGIELAPNDGKFYHDLGNIYLMRKQKDLAAEFFEKGIEMDNKFSSNYYWACKSLLSSSNYWWGLIYGEIFLNLERNSARTYEISKLLYENYNKITKIGQDSLFRVQITSQKWETKFEQNCQEIWFKTSVKPQASKIASLCELRRVFLRNYLTSTVNKNQIFLLMAFWKDIDDDDFWEAYNFWLFNQGNEPEFEAWAENNTPIFGRFITWFVQHPLAIGEKKVTRK